MSYKKQAHTKLHHIETHRHDDGSYTVEAHLIHRPPPTAKKGAVAGQTNQMAYASPHDFDYPNKTFKMGAADLHEASTAHQHILEAHQHEGGTRKPHVSEPDYEQITE